jgi:transcriptional regulator with XRE-family HTH domain
MKTEGIQKVAPRNKEPTEESRAMGQRLQQLRIAAEMSQPQLARAAGVPVSSLRNWEQGRRVPLFDAAIRLAVALGCTLDELAGIGPAEEKKGKAKGK